MYRLGKRVIPRESEVPDIAALTEFVASVQGTSINHTKTAFGELSFEFVGTKLGGRPRALRGLDPSLVQEPRTQITVM